MYIKHDEEGKIVSLFLGCTPDNADEYEEVPDDEAVAKAFFDEQRSQQRPQATAEDRIAALEAQLAAYEAAYTEGVNEA